MWSSNGAMVPRLIRKHCDDRAEASRLKAINYRTLDRATWSMSGFD
jgi:hypothetical protein